MNKVLATGAIVALAVGAIVVENSLRGHVEYRETFSVRNGDELIIPIDKAGVEHTLELYTSGKTSLTLTLTNPDGLEVVSDTELTSKKGKRLYDFTPYQTGEWVLSVERRALSGRVRGSGTVSVLTGDKRPFGCHL